jgi:hypothetical protein
MKHSLSELLRNSWLIASRHADKKEDFLKQAIEARIYI